MTTISGAQPPGSKAKSVATSDNAGDGTASILSEHSTSRPLRMDNGRRYNTPTVELRLSDVLNDPLIALVNRADRVSGDSFAQLLQSAARLKFKQKRRHEKG